MRTASTARVRRLVVMLALAMMGIVLMLWLLRGNAQLVAGRLLIFRICTLAILCGNGSLDDLEKERNL
ncbi:hypothetical protein HDV57DRAFT_506234 [Trichoderma longibrachiatum]